MAVRLDHRRGRKALRLNSGVRWHGRVLVYAAVPWIRTIVSLPLGLVAIQLFHLAAACLVPDAYGELTTDPDRWLSLTLVTIAGILGSAVVGAVARHRLKLHMFLFLLVMLVIDIAVVKGELAAQPIWFKGLVITILPLQIYIGARLAMLTFPKGASTAAI